MSLLEAARSAREWLEAQAPQDDSARALRDLGLLLCDEVVHPRIRSMNERQEEQHLPPAAELVQMQRRALLDLMQRVTLGEPGAPASVGEGDARILGALALSYARDGDVSCVAAIVRAAAHASLRDARFEESVDYLVDQQRLDGSFGLLAPEFAALPGRAARDPTKRLTVEVLWALAEGATAWGTQLAFDREA